METVRPGIVSVSEAARIIGCSEDSVRHAANTGKLDAMKTGRGVRIFYKADVEAFAEQRAKGATKVA